MIVLARCVVTISLAASLLAGCDAPSQTSAIAPARSAAHRLSSSYQQLYLFRRPIDGSHPQAGLLDVNGTLYGTTSAGGLSHKGIVYRISTSGVPGVLYRFRGGSDGLDPQSGLLNVNGTLYGTTESGGGSSGCPYGPGCGTVYTVGTSGGEKVLYAFKGGTDGANPAQGLIDVNGTLYGTTPQGGGSGCYDHHGCGTVFSVTTAGQETVLHRFAGGSDGANPGAGLIDVDGVLYGTTAAGGDGCNGGCGTVFSITPSGGEKVLYAFQGGSDGFNPEAGLIDVNGTLYGTTYLGGEGNGGNGTIYSISTAGAEKVIYSFTGVPDGANPAADLIEAGGTLYGTTTAGGISKSPCILGDGCGTVFTVTTGGVETVLYRFGGGTDGFTPLAPVTSLNGTLYGTTYHGGDHDKCCVVYGYGTAFALTP